MKINNKILGTACKILLPIAFIYGLVLPLLWGNNPLSPLGTLSLLCEDRKIFFWLWGILTAGSILLSAQYLFDKFNFKNKIINSMCVMSFISMCGIALSLGHSIEDWNPKRIIHWVATGFFIAFTLLPIFIFFLMLRKKHKYFGIMSLCVLAVFLSFAVIFVAVGKCALMEMIPIAMIEVLMYIVCFTPLLKNE